MPTIFYHTVRTLQYVPHLTAPHCILPYPPVLSPRGSRGPGRTMLVPYCSCLLCTAPDQCATVEASQLAVCLRRRAGAARGRPGAACIAANWTPPPCARPCCSHRSTYDTPQRSSLPDAQSPLLHRASQPSYRLRSGARWIITILHYVVLLVMDEMPARCTLADSLPGRMPAPLNQHRRISSPAATDDNQHEDGDGWRRPAGPAEYSMVDI